MRFVIDEDLPRSTARALREAGYTEYPLKTHAGIIASRIPDEISTETLNRELLNALKQLNDENLTNTLVIVEIGQIRIRR